MSPQASLDRLVACLAKLPGVGRRSAERMALKLVREPDRLADALAAALQECRRTLRCCARCGSITSLDREPCRLCTDPHRDDGLLCVVEEPDDIALIEKCGEFVGRYHALMGKVSPMKGEGPGDLRVRALLARVEQEAPREVILALSTDVEGDATAAFLAEQLRVRGVRVSRLAFGLPSGSGIAYSDPVTLARAIKGRQAEG